MSPALEVFNELVNNTEFYNGLGVKIKPNNNGESCIVSVLLPNGKPASKLQTYPLVAALVLSYFDSHPLFSVIQPIILSHAESWADVKRADRAEQN